MIINVLGQADFVDEMVLAVAFEAAEETSLRSVLHTFESLQH